MGNSSTPNSYVAELYGIYLALQRITQQRLSTRQSCHYIIAVDSQYALRSLILPKCQSGQFIIKLIMEQIEKLKGSNRYVNFRWIPAQEGIPRNERAHTLASNATEPNNPSPPATGLKRLKKDESGFGQNGACNSIGTQQLGYLHENWTELFHNGTPWGYITVYLPRNQPLLSNFAQIISDYENICNGEN